MSQPKGRGKTGRKDEGQICFASTREFRCMSPGTRITFCFLSIFMLSPAQSAQSARPAAVSRPKLTARPLLLRDRLWARLLSLGISQRSARRGHQFQCRIRTQRLKATVQSRACSGAALVIRPNGKRKQKRMYEIRFKHLERENSIGIRFKIHERDIKNHTVSTEPRKLGSKYSLRLKNTQPSSI